MKKYLLLIAVVSVTGLFGQTLTQAEKATILKKWEEEKMARDLYRSFADKWDANVFTNITTAEMQHMKHVKDLAKDFNIEGELPGGKDGIYQDKEVQKEYNELKRLGEQSLADALRAAAKVEESDIVLLRKEVAAAKNTALKSTWEMLLRASENHLRAFVRNMDQQGIDYTPVLLDKAAFEKIINNQNRKGNNQRGHGRCCSN